MTDPILNIRLSKLANLVINFVELRIKSLYPMRLYAIVVYRCSNRQILEERCNGKVAEAGLEWAKKKALLAIENGHSSFQHYYDQARFGHIKNLALVLGIDETARNMIGGVCLRHKDEPLLAIGVHGLGIAEKLSDPVLNTEFANHLVAENTEIFFSTILRD